MLRALRSLVTLIHQHHERRVAIRTLSMMDDHQLADIGIHRGALVQAVDGYLPQHGLRG